MGMHPLIGEIDRAKLGSRSCNLYRLDPLFWRYSLRPLQSFEFYRCKTQAELLQLVRDGLKKNSALARWLDTLARRPQGHFSNLAERRDRSNAKRSLTYAAALLISSVIRNDTGVRGGLSCVSSSPEIGPDGRETRFSAPPIPAEIRVINVDDREAYELFSVLRKTHSELLIPVDSRPRISLSEKELQSIDAMCIELFSHALSVSNIPRQRHNVILAFAVDFVKHREDWLPLEWHLPGRGIGMHFIGAMKGAESLAGLIGTTVSGIVSHLLSLYGSYSISPAQHGHKTAFHRIDDTFIRMLNPEDSQCGPRKPGKKHSMLHCEADVPDLFPAFDWPKRSTPKNMVHIESLVLDGNEDIDHHLLSDLSQRFGPWVVAKQLHNLPWWHKNRRRPEFLLLTMDTARKPLMRLLKTGPVQVQPVVKSSLDDRGHFGELRVYCLAVPA